MFNKSYRLKITFDGRSNQSKIKHENRSMNNKTIRIDCLSFHDFRQFMYNRLFFQLKNENPTLSKTESQ